MKILVMILVTLSTFLTGCQESVQHVRETAESTKAQVASPSNREERKVEALADVKKTAEDNALPPVKIDLATLSGHRLNDLYVEYLALPKGKLAPPSVTV